MHKYQGMDYKQIGDVLKLSESATKSLLFRAYQTLRDKLKEFGSVDRAGRHRQKRGTYDGTDEEQLQRDGIEAGGPAARS
jgi:hypothetical protein